MKAVLTGLLLVFCLNLCCQDDYGQTWTKVFKAKNKFQAKKIIFRYKLANIGQSYYVDDGKFYIELAYEDDDDEKFWKYFYCIPKRWLKQLIIVEFLTFDGKNALDLGGSNLKIE